MTRYTCVALMTALVACGARDSGVAEAPAPGVSSQAAAEPAPVVPDPDVVPSTKAPDLAPVADASAPAALAMPGPGTTGTVVVERIAGGPWPHCGILHVKGPFEVRLVDGEARSEPFILLVSCPSGLKIEVGSRWSVEFADAPARWRETLRRGTASEGWTALYAETFAPALSPGR